MAGEANANSRYRSGAPGYYVVNPKTDLAVAGPYGSQRAAEREAGDRDAMYPHDPTHLQVMVIGEAS